MLIPALAAFCLDHLRERGISWYISVVSVVVKPFGWPAAESSCLALAMFWARWGVVSVDGKFGANGLSLPIGRSR